MLQLWAEIFYGELRKHARVLSAVYKLNVEFCGKFNDFLFAPENIAQLYG